VKGYGELVPMMGVSRCTFVIVIVNSLPLSAYRTTGSYQSAAEISAKMQHQDYE